MSSHVEQSYQDIGQAAMDLADDLVGKLLIYAEVEDGVISADFFYVNQSGRVRFRFCPKAMRELIYSFWQQWQQQPGNREWRSMSYVINGKKFSIDLIYPEQLDASQNTSDRRPEIVKKHFGKMKVDYSKPS